MFSNVKGAGAAALKGSTTEAIHNVQDAGAAALTGSTSAPTASATEQYKHLRWRCSLWQVRMAPVKKHMVGGILVPTARTALAGLLQRRRMVRIEVRSSRAVESSDDAVGDDTTWELQDSDGIFLRIFLPPKKGETGEEKEENADEHSDGEHSLHSLETQGHESELVGKEHKRYRYEDVEILKSHKNVCEMKLGAGHSMIVRDLKFESELEAQEFQTVWQRMVKLTGERTKRQIAQYTSKQRLLTSKKSSPRGAAGMQDLSIVQEGEETPELIELLVEIVGASNLPAADVVSTDPYVKVRMGGKEVHRTKTVSKNMDPVWTLATGSLFLLQMSPEQFFSSTGGMSFVVMDFDSIGSNETLGTVSVSLEDLLAGTGERTEHTLQMDQKMAKAVKKKGEDTKLYLRVKAASESDKEFLQAFKDNPKKLGLYIDETFLPLRPPASSFLHGQKKKDHGTTLLRVKPFPDPSRPQETKWMTEEQIDAESKKPSTHWVEAGSGEHGKVYVELLGADGLPNMDSMTLNPMDSTDCFGCFIFEDAIVLSDVISNSLSPRWPPWCRRAFALNIFQPTSDILLALFDFDPQSSPMQQLTRAAASDLHDPIGRVRINLSKLAPDTTYDLKYPLYYGETEEYRKTSKGTVHVRLRLEFADVRKAMISALVPQQVNYVSVAKKSDFDIAHYTADGVIDERDFSMTVFTKYIEELQSYEIILSFFAEAALVLWLWRGHYKVKAFGKTIKLPLHSFVAYVWAILVTWDFNLFPSFLLFAIAWLLLATNEHVKRHPSPWKTTRGYFGLLRLFLLDSIPPDKIPPNFHIEEVKEYEENERMAKEKDKRRKEQEEKFEKELLAEMQGGAEQEDVDIASPDTNLIPLPGVSVNPLKPILYPIQKELLKAVTYVRIAKTVVLWEETYYSFWLVTFALVGSALCFFIPWAFLLRWILRVTAWLLLGPWMMLVDKYYVQKKIVTTEDQDTDEAIRKRIKERYSGALESATHARLRRERALKLKAMKRFCFGKYLIENPVYNEDLYWDTPLPESSATPCTDPPSIEIAEKRYGQQLTGDMIPEREIQMSGKKRSSKPLINKSLLQKGIAMPKKHVTGLGKGIGAFLKKTPFAKPFQRGVGETASETTPLLGDETKVAD